MCSKYLSFISTSCENQGWDFAHWFFERLDCFCEWKSERAIRLWKRANLCCRAFVLSDLSESLIVTLFKRTTGVNRLQSLFCSEWHERFIGFAHYRSLKKSDWAVLSKRAKSKWAKSEFPTLVKINMQILTALKICLNCKYFKLIFLKQQV